MYPVLCNFGALSWPYVDLLQVVPGLDSETHLKSLDENQVVYMKIEDMTATQEEEDPVLDELGVSSMFMCILLGQFRGCRELLLLFLYV